MYVYNDGVCSTKYYWMITNKTNVTSGMVGISLETNKEESEKLVECILKV